jgi:branched-chain amino acid transport system substrate-binding protein
MKRVLPCFVLLGFLLCTLTFIPAAAVAEEEVVIGCSLPFTGGLSSEAPYFRDGYQLGVEMINASGGLMGKKVKLIMEDDQTDPAKAITIYEKLLTKNRAVALFGPLGSSVTAAAAGVAEKHKVPIISSYAAGESLYTQGYRYHFGIAASKYFGGSYSVPFVDMIDGFDKWAPKGTEKPTKIAIIGVSGAYGRDAVDRCVKRAKEIGLDVVHEGMYDAKTGDFTPMLQKIKASGAQVLCAVSYYNDSVILARGIAKLKMKFKAVFLGTGPDLAEWKELGPIGYNYCTAYPLSSA